MSSETRIADIRFVVGGALLLLMTPLLILSLAIMFGRKTAMSIVSDLNDSIDGSIE